MAHRIRCFTLFDITQTGVANRSKPTENDDKDWLYKRNTQCNFDTILQVISLRSQPDIISSPETIQIVNYDYFGYLYEKKSQIAKCWTFDFEVQHTSVFEDGKHTLGSLYNDCKRVPMILFDNQSLLIPNTLDISDELKNIHFEVI